MIAGFAVPCVGIVQGNVLSKTYIVNEGRNKKMSEQELFEKHVFPEITLKDMEGEIAKLEDEGYCDVKVVYGLEKWIKPLKGGTKK